MTLQGWKQNNINVLMFTITKKIKKIFIDPTVEKFAILKQKTSTFSFGMISKHREAKCCEKKNAIKNWNSFTLRTTGGTFRLSSILILYPVVSVCCVYENRSFIRPLLQSKWIRIARSSFPLLCLPVTHPAPFMVKVPSSNKQLNCIVLSFRIRHFSLPLHLRSVTD